SRAARRSPPRSISSTLARDTRTSAASMPASTPASGTSSAATTIRATSVALISHSPHGPGLVPRPAAPRSSAGPRARSSRLRAGPPGLEQLRLQGEHLPLLLRLGVVVAEQVQHPVHGEQLQLRGERVAGGPGAAARVFRAEHDVTEQRRTGLVLVGGAGGVEL